MYNGQEPPEIVRGLAAANACKKRCTASKALFGLTRDLSAIERPTGREAKIADLIPFVDEWYRVSEPFLDAEKTRDDYLAELVAGLRKVRVPTGEGETLNKALQAVAKLSPSELPLLPGLPNAPESWRRLAALHRELSRRTGGSTYFLGCRDAAKAFPGLSYQAACHINAALERLGVIKTVRVGDQRPNGKASEFRYLLSQSEKADVKIAA
ncbi:MAG: hypothetical protein ACREFF_08855 [Candidatus Udaeobacter sp.]